MSRYFFVFVLIIVGFGIVFKYVPKAVFIPIEVVSMVNKLQYADPDAIKAVMNAHVMDGFFGLRVGQIRKELKQIPWVADAIVQRCWPNTVKIKIFEKQALARFQTTGVIDTAGKLFFPKNSAKLESLPEFVGDAEDIDSMVDKYLMMLSKLKPIGLTVKRLEIMADRGWQAVLDNELMIILGQVELEERLARFVAAYDLVLNAEPKLKVVDLRYTNGLAVG